MTATFAALGEWFEKSMRVNAARPAIVGADFDAIDYARLDAWSATAAAALDDMGVRQGDVVAVLTGNRAEFVVTDVAVARLGAVKLPVNQQLPAATIAYMLDDSAARALVVAPPYDELAEAALAEAAIRPPVLRVGETFPERPAAGGAVGDVAHPRPDSTAPAALYYTGGTTGRPKGVVHSQASLVSFHTAQLLEAEIRQQDRLLLVTPLAHAAGLFAQSAVLRGATVELGSAFDAGAMLTAFRERGITWTFLVPTMLYRLLDELPEGSAGFPTLATIVYGAAPISPDRLQTALDRFGPVFIQLYAQTECPNWGTRLVKADHRLDAPELLSSCGQASIMAGVKIVDDDGKDVAAGEVGEVCLRSPYILDRYHNNPEATAEKFIGEWIRTGDIGLLDENGYLYLKDRRADMVISGGMNVYCREVEDVLMEHPDVRVAAVIGIPHDDWGEAVHAVVTSSGGLTVEALIEWTRGRLPAYARPKSAELVAALPETPFGKIDKKALRAPYWAGRDRAIN